MKKNAITFKEYHSGKERVEQEELQGLLKNCPIPEKELISNLPLFLRRQDVARILFMNHLYQEMIDTHGIIMEFGIRWGRNISLLQSLRGTYEPYNYNRKIVGFDTFSGFPSVSKKDGAAEIIEAGAFNVTDGYEKYLSAVCDYHEAESPISHIKKYELVKGDASVSIKKYLKDHPETIIALVYLDLDIYQPTKDVLQAIRGHLTKGSVIAFDELNHSDFPGETLALKEVFGLDGYSIRQNPYGSMQSYIVIE